MPTPCFTEPSKLISNGSSAFKTKAARLVFACGRDQSSSHLLCTLHWLPVEDRIKYKILLYVYKSLNNQAPKYLAEILKLYNASNSTEGSRRRLRSSSDATRLAIPRSKRQAGDNSFHVCGPRLWNGLPVSIREAPSVTVFKRQLKTHLFPKYWFFSLCVIVYIACIFPCIYCFVSL